MTVCEPSTRGERQEFPLSPTHRPQCVQVSVHHCWTVVIVLSALEQILLCPNAGKPPCIFGWLVVVVVVVVVILLNRVVVVFFTWKGYGVEGGEGVSGLCCCCCCCSSVCLFVFACLLA